mgnify:CR=1 FL=1
MLGLLYCNKKWKKVKTMPLLQDAPNIGKVLCRQLNDVDITTIEQLREIGSREAWIRIRFRDPTACLNRLCALEGAIRGIHWHRLEQEVKDELRSFYHANKA